MRLVLGGIAVRARVVEVDPGCLVGTMESVLWKLEAGVILGVVRVVDADPFTPPSTETERAPPSEVARTSCIASTEFPFTPRSVEAERAEGALTGED